MRCGKGAVCGRRANGTRRRVLGGGGLRVPARTTSDTTRVRPSSDAASSAAYALRSVRSDPHEALAFRLPAPKAGSGPPRFLRHRNFRSRRGLGRPSSQNRAAGDAGDADEREVGDNREVGVMAGMASSWEAYALDAATVRSHGEPGDIVAARRLKVETKGGGRHCRNTVLYCCHVRGCGWVKWLFGGERGGGVPE